MSEGMTLLTTTPSISTQPGNTSESREAGRGIPLRRVAGRPSGEVVEEEEEESAAAASESTESSELGEG